MVTHGPITGIILTLHTIQNNTDKYLQYTICMICHKRHYDVPTAFLLWEGINDI